MSHYILSLNRPKSLPSDAASSGSIIYVDKNARTVIGKFCFRNVTLWCTAKNMDTKISSLVMTNRAFSLKINKYFQSKDHLNRLKYRDRIVEVDSISEAVVRELILGGKVGERIDKDIQGQEKKMANYKQLKPIIDNQSILKPFRKIFRSRYKQEKLNDKVSNLNLRTYGFHDKVRLPHDESPIHNLCFEMGMFLKDIIDNPQSSSKQREKAEIALKALSTTDIAIFRSPLFRH